MAELGTKLSETTASIAADDPGLPDERLDASGPVASLAAVATTDAEATADLLADSRPTLLVEPFGELVASAPELDAAEIALDQAPPAAIGAPSPEQVDAGEGVAAALRHSDPAVDAPGGLSAIAPASTIPQHLARIGERYTAAPVAELATPMEHTAEPNHPAAAQPAAGGSTIAVSLDGATGSTAIVQDDELVAIRLGELVSLLEDHFEQPLYVWIKSSAAASKFVTAETLAAAGIRTRYDPQRRQIVFSTTAP